MTHSFSKVGWNNSSGCVEKEEEVLTCPLLPKANGKIGLGPTMRGGGRGRGEGWMVGFTLSGSNFSYNFSVRLGTLSAATYFC